MSYHTDGLIEYLNKKIKELTNFKIPKSFEDAFKSKKELQEIQKDIANKTYFINKEDSLKNANIYNLYSRLTVLVNALLNEANEIIIEHLSNFYIEMINKQKENEENISDIQKETKKILPQIITFSSLFVAVISLVVTNISIFPDFTLKSLLLINLSFILAITIIFFLFILLWSDSLFRKHNKISVCISFITVISFVIMVSFGDVAVILTFIASVRGI